MCLGGGKLTGRSVVGGGAAVLSERMNPVDVVESHFPVEDSHRQPPLRLPLRLVLTFYLYLW
jgi:hypothetical protein